MTPSQRLRSAVLGTALLAAACRGRVVDLSQAGADPDYLALTDDQVLQLTVDDQRLYWGSFTNRGTDVAIRSCEKQACKESQVTYLESQYPKQVTELPLPDPIPAITSFGVQNGEVFWFRAADSSWELVACSIAGCQGEPRIAAELPNASEDGLREAVFDDRFAYYFGPIGTPSTELNILRAPLSGQGTLASPIATSVSVETLAIHDDYIYWLGVDPAGGGTSTNSGFVQRVRKDGSTAPERLVSNVELIAIAPQERSAHLELAVDAEHFYWSRNALLGAIFRCPLAGCTGPAEKVTSPTRFPLGLLSDGPNLYWAYRSDVSSYSIATCAASACQPALGFVQGSTSANVLTTDDEYLYTATTETPFDNYDQWSSITSTIRRLPK